MPDGSHDNEVERRGEVERSLGELWWKDGLEELSPQSGDDGRSPAMSTAADT